MLQEVHLRENEFDVIHFHVDLLHFPFFEELAHKTLTTLHGRLDLEDLPEAYARWPQYPLVSISNHQRLPLPTANWVRTIQHGLSDDLLGITTEPKGDYLAFLGRISPEKRPDRAVAIARRRGLKLKIAAKVDAVDRAYFADVIEPLLGEPGVEFVGEIGDPEKPAFLGNAAALLFPIDWPEPFGLVMIGAMACGTPVIAWRCGAVPEIVDEGVTGFIVASEDEVVSAVQCVRSGRAAIRRVFQRRFSSKIMARNYLALYWNLAHGFDPDLRIAASG